MKLCAAFLLALALPAGALADAQPTFCNPLNLDYGWSGKYRHGADPVIVLFKDHYYLFSTSDVAGFRVSEDLLHWRTISFPHAIMPLMVDSERQGYCAPAVAADREHLYFLKMSRRKNERMVPLLRTTDPLSGKWEQCGQLRRVGDPALFLDEDGRAWLYHGLGQPSKVFEVDRRTWTEIPGSERQLRPALTNLAEAFGGYERGRRDLFAEMDAAPFLDQFRNLPCQEANWMTKYQGRYYLQYSTPGTVSHWYCDTVLEAPGPTGPFRLADYAPVSMKVGGFIGSAGHSGVFQDKFGNWWRVTTMWIGVHDLFERRLGLFPVGFDAAGRMFTETALGDYPQALPQGLRQAGASPLAGWWVQSFGKHATASSSLSNHPPELAADKNVRTWWSAQTGNPGEWFQLDLGKPCRLTAVQVNFAEQDCQAVALHPADEFHQYKLLGSDDGQTWRELLDQSSNQIALSHDYNVFPQPVNARWLKVVNTHMPAGGKFALSDLRVFGSGENRLPEAVTGLQVRRHQEDDRNVTFTWRPVAHATGYLVRYGLAPDKLWQCVQLQGNFHSTLTLHTLNRGVRYAYRVDAFNDSGLTTGNCVQPPWR